MNLFLLAIVELVGFAGLLLGLLALVCFQRVVFGLTGNFIGLGLTYAVLTSL